MIKKISTTYKREDKIDFIIDDDEEMNWIANFDSKIFNRFFVVIDKKVKELWSGLINKNLEKLELL